MPARGRPVPPKSPPHVELIALRKATGLRAYEFAASIGITRMHMTSIEQGRRPPSLDLALRWVEALPGARLDMFGPLPLVEQRLASIERLQSLQKTSPETYKAA